MKVLTTSLKDVFLIEQDVFGDRRGYFMETYQKKRYVSNCIETEFVQDNLSYSTSKTLHGLHYQFPNAQAKLIQEQTVRLAGSLPARDLNTVLTPSL